MTKQVEVATATESAQRAWDRMSMQQIRHLVVLDRGKPVGVLSDRDLGGSRGASLRKDHSVVDLMSSPVVTATPETTVRQAANLLRGRTIGCLPILARGRVVGMVTTSDLLDLIGRGAERPIATSTRWTLGKGRGPRGRKRVVAD